MTHSGAIDFSTARAKLIADLARQIRDERVLEAMAKVPREYFVPPELLSEAYDDRPLPIGLGQTISQPLMIAIMTSALALTGKEKVLELGTGSGYNTAILAELARRVVSVERLPELAEKARQTLDRLGYTDVEIQLAGEELGWPEGAPYQAILVTAGAPRVPDSLAKQLDVYGRLVIPVGSRYDQDLVKVTRLPRAFVTESLGPCRFVPLIGTDAWDSE